MMFSVRNITFCNYFISIYFLPKKSGAEGQPNYFHPFSVYVGMQTGAYVLEDLVVKEFLPNALPINWITPRDNPPPFEDYSIFIQYGNQRFVSQANRVTHTAQSIFDARQPTPMKTYIHLNQDLWLQSESFEIFTVTTQQGHEHYNNRIFITIPETHTVYTAQFATISRPRPAPSKLSRYPRITIGEHTRRIFEGRMLFD